MGWNLTGVVNEWGARSRSPRCRCRGQVGVGVVLRPRTCTFCWPWVTARCVSSLTISIGAGCCQSGPWGTTVVDLLGVNVPQAREHEKIKRDQNN